MSSIYLLGWVFLALIALGSSIILSSIFLILKLFSLISWNWLLVFSPFLTIGLISILFLTILILTRKKMSRSFKKHGCQKMYRHPKGRKKAIINNARKRAIPPSSWEGIHHSRDCDIPWRVARKMRKEGASEQRILKTLLCKFELDHNVSNYIIDIVFKYYKPFWRS